MLPCLRIASSSVNKSPLLARPYLDHRSRNFACPQAKDCSVLPRRARSPSSDHRLARRTRAVLSTVTSAGPLIVPSPSVERA